LRSRQAHPSASPEGVSPTSCNSRHSGQPTEIRDHGTGTPKGHPPRARNALSGSEKGRVNRSPGFNCKLRDSAASCTRGWIGYGCGYCRGQEVCWCSWFPEREVELISWCWAMAARDSRVEVCTKTGNRPSLLPIAIFLSHQRLPARSPVVFSGDITPAATPVGRASASMPDSAAAMGVHRGLSATSFARGSPPSTSARRDPHTWEYSEGNAHDGVVSLPSQRRQCLNCQ